ncbi:tryptophan-rich sensory protein [Microbacterium aurantiacum]|uniref:Tryptophan-rich sensory protein n=1 Tax=Microbacterium aurantiacum TaxID=162393 RepID=A0ABT8FNS6_9MICO|nr:tryptophan-rich sensory protein [Microbacterium aurantiacum]MBN9201745.1 tryptophan-rich sensory protein [Microbacterium chocolatum]MDN4462976.1 tryptophan-rich sensory protein [Microbacterium aurantiacum]ODT09415.1 MAG: hypothetical protein ABS61_13130 [Microbacterium sp. SCN 70-18]
MNAPRDLLRQIVVISAVVFMLVAAAVGTGAFGGTPVQDLQGGALDADASLLAPATPAFSIWSVIYILLIAYAIWQALPSQRTRDRQRAIGWLVAITAVLNGLWLVLAQFTTLPLTVAGIVLLLVALCVTFRRTVTEPGRGVLDSLLIDGVTGLHLGWVSLATVANTAAWLTATGPADWAAAGEIVAVIVLAVVAVIGVGIAWASRWRIAPGLALAWGLSWLAVGRLVTEPQSTVVGIAAIVVAVIVIAVPLVGTVIDRAAQVSNAGA